MQSIGTIRKFKTKQFSVIVDAIPDDTSIDELAGDCGEDYERDLADKLSSGEWINFTARARVFYRGNEIAADYLGACVYESLDTFMDHKECGRQNREWAAKGESGRCGSYFVDMVRQVCNEARATIREMQSVHVRQS